VTARAPKPACRYTVTNWPEPHNLNPADAGFGSYAKLWKPFFIGRDAFIAHEEKRDRILVRFRMNDKAVRRPETGDPVLDKRGKVVGTVTSCAVDSEGYMLGLAVLPCRWSGNSNGCPTNSPLSGR
jgi:glycine cleavage system aminomethyltransferase T